MVLARPLVHPGRRSTNIGAAGPPHVYLDYAATTPVDNRVLEKILPYFTGDFGNASSHHECGKRASDAVVEARKRVAEVIGARPTEIIFTAGASEANNLAFFGLSCKKKRGHFVTTNIEHKSVLEPMLYLRRRGYGLTIVPVRSNGIVDLSDIAAAIESNTILCSVMAVNNELGTIQPTAEISGLCRERGVLFHTDATQGFGKIPLSAADADLMSLSAHKIYGPKGVGALYRRKGVPLECHIRGGGQESGMRAGTLNVPGIVGLGAASELSSVLARDETARLKSLSQRLRLGLAQHTAGVRQNGDLDRRVPWIHSLSFPESNAQKLCGELGLCMSRGSACSKLSDMSHVLRAIGLSEALCSSTVRITLGRFTTEDEVDEAVARISNYLRDEKRAS